MKKISSNNKSGFAGVYWHEKAKKWGVQIYVKNKKIYVGLFACNIEAAKAYNDADLRYLNRFDKLNQI
jgi:AP2 domain